LPLFSIWRKDRNYVLSFLADYKAFDIPLVEGFYIRFGDRISKNKPPNQIIETGAYLN
jgi:hypothetical protein